jgi:hypothetical protein
MAIADGEQTAGQRKERPAKSIPSVASVTSVRCLLRQKKSTFLETIWIVLFNVLLKTDDEL